MNSEKGVSNYEIVSEESDHHQLDDSAGTKRSNYYECTFCKRGFTNAQALGGHMNIHRRDRAKAKAPNSTSSLPINNIFNDSMAYPSEIPSYQPTQSNYEVYFHPPGAPPHAFQYEFYNPRSQPMRFDQELQGPNLSLQIGPSHVDDDIHQVRRRDQKDGEVDLELRLGHHPY